MKKLDSKHKITNHKSGFTLTRAQRSEGFTLMKQASVREAAFTLIELLVVISIIGILAALATASFGAAQKQARDTERKSDLKQYQNALELQANKNSGLYVSYVTDPGVSALCTGLEMNNCPQDPKYEVDPSNYSYHYLSDGTGDVTATKYVLWAKIEGTSGYYWVVCSTGQSGKIATSTTFSDGECPDGLIME